MGNSLRRILLSSIP
ncbi:MAG: hypothetical protein LBQ24_01090 [Candidatus Peribacteria bacterium]|nr:hypothetical protein [Candidatus Peribacteria bacterium]